MLSSSRIYLISQNVDGWGQTHIGRPDRISSVNLKYHGSMFWWISKHKLQEFWKYSKFTKLVKTMRKYLLSEKIKILAESLGIDAIGFTQANGFAGYILSQHRRRDPKLTMPNAKSIIIAGIYIGGVTMPEWKNPWYGRTSRLYLSEFFLDVVKPLVPISDFLKTVGYQAITGISYDLFHRNVLIAMERAEKLTERTYQ